MTADAYDALVIGGGIGGLVAACYLARGGVRTLLLEARDSFGGSAETVELMRGLRAPLLSHAVYALDPRMLRDLRLERHGLAFAETDMTTAAFRPGEEPIVLPGAKLSRQAGFRGPTPADSMAFGSFLQTVRAFARQLRPLWTGALEEDSREPASMQLESLTRALRLSAGDSDRLIQLAHMSAAHYLDQWFESDALKAALGFEATAGGLSPSETGSALSLIWRCAQESAGIQAAVSFPRGGLGALSDALAAAAKRAGAELCSGSRVTSIFIDGERAGGVELEGGDRVRAGAVISNLDVRETLLGMAPPQAMGFGAAAHLPNPAQLDDGKLLLALDGMPPFAGLESEALCGRLLIAGQPEMAAEAKDAALSGRLPRELMLEAILPSVVDPSLAPSGRHTISVVIRFLPLTPEGGWNAIRSVLETQCIAALEAYAPGLKDRIVASCLLTPEDIARRYGGTIGGLAVSQARLLSRYGERVRTPLPGLFLCGSSAEPVTALSGRAGRIAAGYALDFLRQKRRDTR